MAFTFLSDEFNGITHDNRSKVRPRLRCSFQSLSKAKQANTQQNLPRCPQALRHDGRRSHPVADHGFRPVPAQRGTEAIILAQVDRPG
jgi:hypothetical protein